MSHLVGHEARVSEEACQLNRDIDDMAYLKYGLKYKVRMFKNKKMQCQHLKCNVCGLRDTVFFVFCCLDSITHR